MESRERKQRTAVLQQLRLNNSGRVSALVSLSGCAGVLELVADFVGGIHRGRELRNARLFAEFVRDLDWSSDLGAAAPTAADGAGGGGAAAAGK